MNRQNQTISAGANKTQADLKAQRRERGWYDIDFNKIAQWGDFLEITTGELLTILGEAANIGKALGSTDAQLDERLRQQDAGIFIENVEESNLAIDNGIKKVALDFNDYQLNLAALLQKGRRRCIRLQTTTGLISENHAQL